MAMSNLNLNYNLVAILVVFFVLLFQSGETQECVRRSYGRGSFVCVCNATHCDSAPSVKDLTPGRAVIISTTRDTARFEATSAQFDISSPVQPTLQINIDVTYQTILGFGGAFTDAAGINIARLSLPAQKLLLESYFSTSGIEYGIGRVPIAGSDFSTYAYSYDDFPGDVTLSRFNLTEEDLVYKIPYINWAKNISSKPLQLFSSPWSAPAWMKSNNDLSGFGHLLPEYYQIWADYFVRFFEEYAKFGVEFWGLTTQNEPNNGRIPGTGFWNSMGWSPENHSLFIGSHLGPTLAGKGLGNLKIMILDDQRYNFPNWPRTVMENPSARPFVSGFGLHWYANDITSARLLDITHEEFPDRFILATEACSVNYTILGSWDRMEDYAFDIIEDLNHWVTGWVDWNLVLDEIGGPNWANNYVDAPILVNNTIDEFYKQPIFYAMGHFSKYIPEGSIRVELVNFTEDATLSNTAFLRPDGTRAVVILNRSDDEKAIVLNDPDRGKLQFNCPPRSLQTVVYG